MIWTVVIGAVYIGILYMFVRPNSPGPQIISNIADALGNLIKGAEGM